MIEHSIKTNIINFVEVDGLSLVDAFERAHGFSDKDSELRYVQTESDLECINKVKRGMNFSVKNTVVVDGLAYLGFHASTIHRMFHGLKLEGAFLYDKNVRIRSLHKRKRIESRDVIASSFSEELSSLLELVGSNRFVEDIVTRLHQNLPWDENPLKRIALLRNKFKSAPNMLDWAIMDLSNDTLSASCRPERGARFFIGRLLGISGIHKAYWCDQVSFHDSENYKVTVGENLSVSLLIPSEARVCDVAADFGAIVTQIESESLDVFQRFGIDSWGGLIAVLDKLQGHKKKSFAKAKRTMSLGCHLKKHSEGRLRNTEGLFLLNKVCNPTFVDKACAERLMNLLGRANRFTKVRNQVGDIMPLKLRDKERFYVLKRIVLDTIARSGCSFDDVIMVTRYNPSILSNGDVKSRMIRSKALFSVFFTELVSRRSTSSVLRDFISKYEAEKDNPYIALGCDTSRFKDYFYSFCTSYAKANGYHSVPYLLVALAGSVKAMQDLFFEPNKCVISPKAFKWGDGNVSKLFSKNFHANYFDVIEFRMGDVVLHTPAILFNSTWLEYSNIRHDSSSTIYGDTPDCDELNSVGEFSDICLEIIELLG
ncbi:hypothetical protein [Photobacterium kishitanii]|uniref:Uncharacterized protein n=1 Tax=Photobacterium kishitanii TaxID=318456 RepID=A0A2T3KLV8_9GAMM|nr:hypothetical protein [Photobacterium kishitanii]PSV00656.1 hypothetical protein C9J27_05825 [Photobacterium kishitanii]